MNNEYLTTRKKGPRKYKGPAAAAIAGPKE